MAAFAMRHLLAGSKPAMAGAIGLVSGLSVPAALAEKKGEKDPGRPMFDPEALERGAAALREINKSPYAKQVSFQARDPPKDGTRPNCPLPAQAGLIKLLSRG